MKKAKLLASSEQARINEIKGSLIVFAKKYGIEVLVKAINQTRRELDLSVASEEERAQYIERVVALVGGKK